ncbi:MAG: hypothetical protein ACYDER_01460 [Ktedonobacteraceae bacterium]
MESEPRLPQSKEYLEQLTVEAIAQSRYPDTRIKEILPGFEAGDETYVWLVILETGGPFENTITTVDTNDIREWHESQEREE